MPPEHSMVWHMVLTELWKDGISRPCLASQLLIPENELENMLFGLIGAAPTPPRGKPNLRLV